MVFLQTPALERHWQVCPVAQRSSAIPVLQEQTVRSTSLQLDLAAGPVTTAELTAAGADQETFTIRNGKEASQRCVIHPCDMPLLAIALQVAHSC